MITLDRKSHNIVTSNLLLSQNLQKNSYFKQEIVTLNLHISENWQK